MEISLTALTCTLLYVHVHVVPARYIVLYDVCQEYTRLGSCIVNVIECCKCRYNAELSGGWAVVVWYVCARVDIAV